RIFDDDGSSGGGSDGCHVERKAWPLAARQGYRNWIGKVAGQKRGKGGLGRGGGAGAGGPAAAQCRLLFCHFRHLASFGAASFSPARGTRHYQPMPVSSS